MKKTLLSMAAMLLLATGASAQKLDLTVAGEANVDSRFNKFEQVAAPKTNGMKKLMMVINCWASLVLQLLLEILDGHRCLMLQVLLLS